MRTFRLGAAALAVQAAFPSASIAQATDEQGEEAAESAALAQQLANPVASLISVPFQLNDDCCTGPDDDGRYTLNIQPVVPIGLDDNWNLIIRTILPVLHQEGFDDRTGLGDTVQSFFLSPADSGDLVWGVGPVFLYPTGTDGFSAREWGAGPTGIVLKQRGGATYGVLANHIWSVDGSGSGSDISATFLQPFFNYTFPSATGLVLNSESTYDWEREEWTAPINFGVTQLLAPGGQRIQLGLLGRVYAETPDDAPDWGVRFVATLLFPA